MQAAEASVVAGDQGREALKLAAFPAPEEERALVRSASEHALERPGPELERPVVLAGVELDRIEDHEHRARIARIGAQVQAVGTCLVQGEAERAGLGEGLRLRDLRS